MFQMYINSPLELTWKGLFYILLEQLLYPVSKVVRKKKNNFHFVQENARVMKSETGEPEKTPDV